MQKNLTRREALLPVLAYPLIYPVLFCLTKEFNDLEVVGSPPAPL